jgi:multidrug efflux pump subunit AcrB
MGFVLFDSKGANGFSAIIELPVGTSLQATADKTKEIEAILANLPEGEVESYATRIGASRQFGDNESEHIATLTVNLTPYSTRVRTADEIVESVREQTAQLTGIHAITFNVQVDGPPTGKPIEIRIVGSDDMLRTQFVNAIVAFLKDMEGVKDVDRDDKAGKDEISIHINYERLARYGLTVADIAQNVRIAYDGQIVTSTRYGEEDVEFRVMLQKQFRQDVEYLKQLRIPNQQGELIALGEIASLHIGPGISVFRHYNGERAVTIEGDVSQGMTTPVEVMNAIRKQFQSDRDYPGIQMIIGGEAAESREAMMDLLLVFGIAALGIYFLLMLLFNSVTQPLIVILAIPFGICGVILAFVLHGEPLSFLAIIGSIGLVGVVVNDSLVLVDHLNELIRQNDGQNLVNVIAAGTADRLRPIILTTLTTVAGLLPLAYGIGGESIEMAPMGLALGYGLLFATPVTLVLIPCLYMIGHDIRTFFTKNEYKGGTS